MFPSILLTYGLTHLRVTSFDTDLPSNCDDEYLGHPDPEKAFKQPPGIPSKMDYFISMIRLNQILAFSQRTLVRDHQSVLDGASTEAGSKRVSFVVFNKEVATDPGIRG